MRIQPGELAEGDLIATVHHYKFGVTKELDPGDLDRVRGLLAEIAKGAGDKYHGVLDYGKVGEEFLYHQPFQIAKKGEA